MLGHSEEGEDAFREAHLGCMDSRGCRSEGGSRQARGGPRSPQQSLTSSLGTSLWCLSLSEELNSNLPESIPLYKAKVGLPDGLRRLEEVRFLLQHFPHECLEPGTFPVGASVPFFVKQESEWLPCRVPVGPHGTLSVEHFTPERSACSTCSVDGGDGGHC